MLRTGPRFRLEERRDCVLVWNERDFSMPRRMVCSFPNHPYDKGEAFILAEICTEALNRKLPGLVAQETEPVEDHGKAQAAGQASPQGTPEQVSQLKPEKETPEPLGDWRTLKGRDKVRAMRRDLFGAAEVLK